MAGNNTDAIILLLCSDDWTWNPDGECTVKFKKDGTGELVCGIEMNVFIASEFDWELRSAPTNNNNDADSQGFATIDIKLTLTKRDLKDDPPISRHVALGDAAFVQKEYRLTLEKGRFRVQDRTHYGHNPLYEYRLLWDKSPYPPLEEWNNQPAAKAGRYWERNDFYTREVKISD